LPGDEFSLDIEKRFAKAVEAIDPPFRAKLRAALGHLMAERAQPFDQCIERIGIGQFPADAAQPVGAGRIERDAMVHLVTPDVGRPVRAVEQLHRKCRYRCPANMQDQPRRM
jgi:hypothetical protein